MCRWYPGRIAAVECAYHSIQPHERTLGTGDPKCQAHRVARCADRRRAPDTAAIAARAVTALRIGHIVLPACRCTASGVVIGWRRSRVDSVGRINSRNVRRSARAVCAVGNAHSRLGIGIHTAVAAYPTGVDYDTAAPGSLGHVEIVDPPRKPGGDGRLYA